MTELATGIKNLDEDERITEFRAVRHVIVHPEWDGEGTIVSWLYAAYCKHRKSKSDIISQECGENSFTQKQPFVLQNNLLLLLKVDQTFRFDRGTAAPACLPDEDGRDDENES